MDLRNPFGRAVALLLLTGSFCTPLRDLDAAAAGQGTAGQEAVPRDSKGASGASGGGGSSWSDSAGSSSGDQGGGGSENTGPSGRGGDCAGASGRAEDCAGASGEDCAGASGRAEDCAGASGEDCAGASGRGEDCSGASGRGEDCSGASGLAGEDGTGGGSPCTGGTAAGGAGCAGTPCTAPELLDLTDPPVGGSIQVHPEATWVIDQSEMPTIEVQTPTASYWLVKSAGALVSITDPKGHQWIGFNSNNPMHGIPALGGCCQAGTSNLPSMTTEVETLSSAHARAVSRSSDGTFHLVWDFFVTHVTVTVNRSTTPFRFTYTGVPGDALDETDKLVWSTNTPHDAREPWREDLQGPDEWVYLADAARSQSMFLIRHGDDQLKESFQPLDEDSIRFVFGDGEPPNGDELATLPIRFSVGLIASVQHAEVAERVNWITNAIH